MRTMSAGYKPKCPKMRKNLAIINYPAIVEIKYDGEWNLFINDGREPHFINKYGKMRVGSLPDRVADAVGKGVFVGELFYGDGKKDSLYEFLANKTSDTLNFKIFDVLSVGDEPARRNPLFERNEHLMKIPNEFLVTKDFVENKEQVETYYNIATNLGYEGIVVKNAKSIYNEGTIEWVKLKEKDQNVYKVVLVDARSTRNRIEVDVNGNNVGVACTNKEGIAVGDDVIIEHYGFLDKGLRNPVYIGKELN